MGCYHMTCRCRRQFCYLCARTWKTCHCSQWDEKRLYGRAEEIIHRNNAALDAGRVLGRQERRRLVAEMAERLRE